MVAVAMSFLLTLSKVIQKKLILLRTIHLVRSQSFRKTNISYHLIRKRTYKLIPYALFLRVTPDDLSAELYENDPG